MWIFLPTLIGLIYWGLIASPRYESRADFYVKADQESAEILGGSSLLSTVLGSGGGNDALVVTSFIQSIDLLHQVDQELALKAHFQDRKWDWFSRLSRNATDLDFLEYSKRRIHVAYDPTSGITTLTVEAFDPAFSQRLAQAILARSERLVNDLGHRMVGERRQFLEQELVQAQKELNQAKQALLSFQNEHGLMSAHGAAEAISSVAAGLEADLAKERVVLKELLSVQPEGSEAVLREQARVAGLEEQLAAEERRLASSDKGATRVNELVAHEQDLSAEVAYKEEAYKVATLAYEQARAQLDQKLKHLLVVVTPNLPDEAADPTVWYNTLTLLVAAIMIYGVGRMVIATIREHRD